MKLYFSLAVMVCLAALPAYADDSLPANECYLAPGSSLQDCTASGALTSTASYVGARSDPNLPGGGVGGFDLPGNPVQIHSLGTPPTYPIDISSPDDWHLCRFVYNTSANSYFIPFRTREEWNDVINNPPPYLTLTHCARPATATIVPGTNCSSPVLVSSTAVFDLGYGRVYTNDEGQNTILGETAKFQCNYSPQRPVLNWYETVDVTYLAKLDSDTNPNVSDWIIKSVSFSGSIVNPKTGTPNLGPDGASDTEIADATTAANALANDDNTNGSQTHDPGHEPAPTPVAH